MSVEVVLDASAVIAFAEGERGADEVEKVLRTATVSAANWTEVLQRAHRAGADAGVAAATLRGMGIRIEPILEDDAHAAARLYLANPRLSLGDRLCLATAERLKQPAYTADLTWKKAVTDAKVVVIR